MAAARLGISLGVRWVDDLAWPFEVSLTRSPRFEDAMVLGVGNAARARALGAADRGASVVITEWWLARSPRQRS